MSYTMIPGNPDMHSMQVDFSKLDKSDAQFDQKRDAYDKWIKTVRKGGVLNRRVVFYAGYAAARAQLSPAPSEQDRVDAERYRWLRDKANYARKGAPMVCLYPLDEQRLIDGAELDTEVDAARAQEKA